MPDFNKVFLIGRLAADPEGKYIESGKLVCNFRLAVNRGYKKDGEDSIADFFNITAWEKKGELCSQYLRKGSLAHVEGRLQTRSYTHSEHGIKIWVTEVVAQNVLFLTPKNQPENVSERAEEKPGNSWEELTDEASAEPLPF